MDKKPSSTAASSFSASSATELQQQRAAKLLAALEKQINERVGNEFFSEEVLFR